MKPSFLASLLFALPLGLFSQETTHIPKLDGYITRAASPTDFDVNGFRVLLEKSARYSNNARTSDRIQVNTLSEPKSYIGAHVQIFGKLDLRKQIIKANEVIFVTDAAEIKGSALIDGIPPPLVGQADGKLLRADGHFILLDSKTAITFAAPLISFTDVGTSVWITYEGTRRDDGVVVASSALLVPYHLTAGEEKVRRKSDYDPTAVRPEGKQSAVSKAFLGVDVRKIPPYPDSAMQARVAKIGESLVPKYQRDLPDGDPAKVRFRFQVVDQSSWRDDIVMPGGVILISKQMVERMENDSQLAAILADGVAGQLEKGSYQLLSLKHQAEIGELLGAVPYGGVIANIAIQKKVSDDVRHIQAQAGRVSLGLMNDAGYTLTEAPKAYWILSTKETKPLVAVNLPEHVAYLYEALGTTWRGAN